MLCIDIVDRLLNAGVNVNEKYSIYRCTPLLKLFSFTYSKEYIIPLMERLILFGADTNSQDTEGNTVLHYACTSPFGTKLIETLLKQGANPTLKDIRGRTAINMCGDETLKNLMIEKAKEF